MGEITKSLLIKLYHKDKLSIRKIASKLNLGKTTIEYYLKKFRIKTRPHKEASKLVSDEYGWTRGLTKEKDERVKKLAESIKRAYELKQKKRIEKIENKFGLKIKDLLIELYLNQGLSQEQIAKKIGYDRKIIIDLMKRFNIPKRPKYQYIVSLKGKHHAMFGKTWKILYNKSEANKRRGIHSLRFRELTIKRLNNNEFPFFDTEIEIILAENLLKAKIPFIKQFNIDNKFSCDFAIPIYKIIIECDGDYWHANPKIYDRKNLDKRQIKNLTRDKFKDMYLKRKGWTVLRFFESDIKLDIDKCINKIKNHISTEELKKIPSPIDSL